MSHEGRPVLVELVDPRDVSWEDEQPAFRVYSWRRASHCWEYEITDADVSAVFAWAESEADGRTYVVYAVVNGHSEDKGPHRADKWLGPHGGPLLCWLGVEGSSYLGRLARRIGRTYQRRRRVVRCNITRIESSKSSPSGGSHHPV